MPDEPLLAAMHVGEPAKFTRRVSLFTAGTALSRLLGLVREQVFAYLFGAGMATDAFNVAFRIPNFFRDLLAENAFSAAFVPELADGLARRRLKEVWRFANNVLTVMFLAVGILVALLMLFAPQVTGLVALGFARDAAKLGLTVQLARIMMPFLLFVALGAWAMGMLNTLGSFFVPAAAPGVFNLVSIVVPIATYAVLQAQGLPPILGMAYGVTIGACFQFLVQLPALYRHGYRFAPILDLKDRNLQQVLLVRLPFRALGLATWQINFLVSTFLITFLPQEGSVTYLNYAYRIMHLPAGLFGVAIGSVALVELSSASSSGMGGLAQERLQQALVLVAVIMLPVAALLIALAEPVVQVIYQHGRFTSADTAATSHALVLYCMGVWAPAASRCIASSFYARKDTHTPALAGLIAVCFCITMNLMLMRRIGFLSFALSTALAQMIDFGILYLIYHRRNQGISDRTLLRLIARIVLMAILCGAAALAVFRVTGLLSWSGTIALLVRLLIAGCSGLVVYYTASRLLGIDEVRATLEQLLPRRCPTSR